MQSADCSKHLLKRKIVRANTYEYTDDAVDANLSKNETILPKQPQMYGLEFFLIKMSNGRIFLN